jgi:uncharacterized membrane protein
MFDIKRFATIIGLLIFVDAFWLAIIGPYASAVTQRIQGSPLVFRWLGAVIVYPAMAYLLSLAKTPGEAFRIGLTTYAVYDFTNYALLKNYDWQLAVADTIWGGTLFTLVYLALKGMGMA